MEDIYSFLEHNSSYIQHLYALTETPPRVLVIEGRDEEHRFLTSIGYSLLLSCSSKEKPCHHCEACTSIQPYITIREEYKQLEQKYKQEHGSYVVMGDVLYLNGAHGIYIKQINALKKHVSDAPRFYKHCIIIENFHAIHSVKEVANALLKVMEETLHSIFIITVPERNRLLQTILSRSYILTLPFIHSEHVTVKNIWFDALIHFLQYSSGWFAKSSSKDICSKEDIREILLLCNVALCEYIEGRKTGALSTLLSQYAPSPTAYTDIIHNAERQYKNNVAPLLIADSLALELHSLLHATKR